MTGPNETVPAEVRTSRRWLWIVAATLAFELLSGLQLAVFGARSSPGASALLLHVGIGSFVLVPALVSLLACAQLPRSIWRGGLTLALGVSVALAALTVLGSGALLAVRGLARAPLGASAHLASSVLLGCALLAFGLPRARSLRMLLARRFQLPSFARASRPAAVALAGLLLAQLAVAALLGGAPPTGDPAARPISSSCAQSACHPQVAREWEVSAHASSALAGASGAVVGCLDCHGGASESLRWPHGWAEAPPGLAGAPGRLMLRAVPSAHAADVQTRPLVCTGCHEQQRHAETRSDVDCVECHMPVSPTRVAAARTHRVLGGWSALGAGGADLEQRELALDWMRGRQLAIDVYPPRDPAAARTRGYVDNAVFAASEATPYVTLGEELALKIVVTNTRIGHGFPGRLGPRQSWLAVRVVDGQNQLVFEAGAPDDAGVEPSDTRVYRNPSDARDAIAPGRSEVNAFAFRVPYWVKGDLTVVARVRYGVARAEAGAATPAVIDLAEATRTFPVRQRPEQEVASRVPR